MNRKLFPFAFAVACLSSLLACGPGGLDEPDSSAASISLDSDTESLELVHDPGLSQVSLTPPVEGVVELRFSYQDPLVDVIVRVDSADIASGDVVDLPEDPDVLEVRVLWGEGTYRSEEGSSGTVDVQVFDTDEEAGWATLGVAISGELADTTTAETITIDGFIESTVGSLDDS